MRCTDLNGHRRILQVAGYAASNKLVRKDQGNDGVTLTETVERMVKLGEIEEIVPSQSLRLVSPRVTGSRCSDRQRPLHSLAGDRAACLG